MRWFQVAVSFFMKQHCSQHVESRGNSQSPSQANRCCTHALARVGAGAGAGAVARGAWGRRWLARMVRAQRRAGIRRLLLPGFRIPKRCQLILGLATSGGRTKGEFSPLGPLAGWFLALGSGLGLV